MSGIGAVADLRPAIGTSAPVHKAGLDQGDFLALLSAQLKNQDPTKPVDNAEYVSQLAQFAQVNGQNDATAQLKTIVAKLDSLIAATAAKPA